MSNLLVKILSSGTCELMEVALDELVVEALS